jgi:hypothetical protein
MKVEMRRMKNAAAHRELRLQKKLEIYKETISVSLII